MFSVEEYTALFSPVHRGKPRWMALAEAVLSQVTDLMALVTDGFPAARLPETAEGICLDAVGELLGVARPAGMEDETYRFLLRAKMAVHHWDGTNGTLPEVLEAAFPGMNARITDNQDGTVTGSLGGSCPVAPEEVLPVPAGVKLINT